MLAAFGAPVEHVFFDAHALAGARHGMDTIVAWHARMKTIFPDLHVDNETMAIGGPPWNTVALVEWRDRFTLRDGSRRANQGVHALRPKWGKVVSLHIYCDTEVLEAVLLRDLEHQGVADAGDAPIDDAARPA